MKRFKKTYAIYSLAEKHTTFQLGKTKVHVSFTGGQVTKNGVNPATFTTTDPIVQLAIERSRDFGKGAITLLAKYPMQGEVKIGRNAPEAKSEDIIQEKRPEPIPEAITEAIPEPIPEAPAGEPEAETEEELLEEPAVLSEEPAEEKDEAGESNLEVVEVSCRDVAKQYLQEHYGEKPAPLRTIADIQECAAKYGITFNFV